jgi:putative aminopeptidase FrvX
VPRQVGELAQRLAGMSAVTGLEQQLVDTLLSLIPGSRRDRAGNAVLILGTGPSRRLAVCPLDEPGYVVGQVRDDGYLTLRRSPGVLARSRDAQLEGQRVSIQTRAGSVPGVVAVRSVHLTRGRERAPGRFTVDSALVDVGATTEAEVAGLGITVLAPVTLHKRPHRYGRDLIAAPMAGRRAACAALMVAARRAAAERGMIPRRESVVIAFVVEQELSGRGIATIANAMGPFGETVLVDGADGEAAAVAERWATLGRIETRSLPVRYPGTAVETVAVSDAERLAGELAAWIGGSR